METDGIFGQCNTGKLLRTALTAKLQATPNSNNGGLWRNMLFFFIIYDDQDQTSVLTGLKTDTEFASISV